MANVLTAKGREMYQNSLKSTSADPRICGWGLNPSGLTSASTDIAPFFESGVIAAGVVTGGESRTTGTSSIVTTTTTNDTYQVVATITANAARAITESFLTDSTTKPAAGVVAAGGVAGSSSSTTLNTAAVFSPGNGTYIQIRTEVMLVTAGSGSQVLTVTRAQNGSAAISTITANDTIQLGNPPGVTSITGGNVFAHSDFAVNNLNNGDSIQFTWQVKLT